MKKLLYILPIVLLMGFVTPQQKAKGIVETEAIVLDFDSTGICLNGIKVSREWTSGDIEEHLGEPSGSIKFMKTANYDDLGLGVRYSDEEMHKFKSFVLFFEKAPEPMQKFVGNVNFFGEEIDFKQSITGLYHQFEDKGMQMDAEKQNCKMRVNTCTVEISYINGKLNLILLTQN